MIYCYRKVAEPHDIIEIEMSYEEMKRREDSHGNILLDDGSMAKRDYSAEHGHFRHNPGSWPMYSDGAGVHPDQIPEAVEASIRAGCPTSFTEDGQAIFTDRAHRAAYLKSRGLFDRDAGYGDPTPTGVIDNAIKEHGNEDS